MELEKELRDLGLSDKEAKVYLAAIQLGTSTVQSISVRSKVNRATTYVIVDGLMSKGMMSTYEEGKKTYLVAEKPDKLVGYFERKIDENKEKIDRLKKVIPEMNVLYNDHSDKPTVKFYGLDTVYSIYDDFLETIEKSKEEERKTVFSFVPLTRDFKKIKSSVQYRRSRNKMVKKGIVMEVIYTSKAGRNKEYEEEVKGAGGKCLFVDYQKCPFDGGVNVYGNKIFMFDYLGQKGGVLVESSTLADMLYQMMQLIWKSNEGKEEI